ncbi:MAG: cupin domain-containing protein [Arenicella sp.]|jgi:mannose-6-phosphate isomerase-like protein (cupin superfamily)|nr:cupin domain-containing protein [Arenicella sp.]HAU69597.1 cupin [Gammaproteobacteria bacterium]
MQYKSLSLTDKLALIDEHWSPRVLAEMNDNQFKLVKVLGEFVWHQHDDTDEVFIVLKGSLRIEFRDGSVQIDEGEMYVVPKGVEHKPCAEAEVHMMLVEPRGVVNTGDAEQSTMTARGDVWV